MATITEFKHVGDLGGFSLPAFSTANADGFLPYYDYFVDLPPGTESDGVLTADTAVHRGSDATDVEYSVKVGGTMWRSSYKRPNGFYSRVWGVGGLKPGRTVIHLEITKGSIVTHHGWYSIGGGDGHVTGGNLIIWYRRTQ